MISEAFFHAESEFQRFWRFFNDYPLSFIILFDPSFTVR